MDLEGQLAMLRGKTMEKAQKTAWGIQMQAYQSISTAFLAFSAGISAVLLNWLHFPVMGIL